MKNVKLDVVKTPHLYTSKEFDKDFIFLLEYKIASIEQYEKFKKFASQFPREVFLKGTH